MSISGLRARRAEWRHQTAATLAHASGVTGRTGADYYTRAKGFSGSNPWEVRVLDPFDNLTEYYFRWTEYDSSTCGTGIYAAWWLGFLIWLS